MEGGLQKVHINYEKPHIGFKNTCTKIYFNYSIFMNVLTLFKIFFVFSSFSSFSL